MTEKEELQAALQDASPAVRPLIKARLLQLHRQTPEAEDYARQAGMAFGIQGYNDAMGYDLQGPGPCGQHCNDCPRCGY